MKEKNEERYGQKKLNVRHSKWVGFMQSFTFSLKYKEGQENIVSDALSRRSYLLAVMEACILDFEILKQHCGDDDDFKVSRCSPRTLYSPRWLLIQGEPFMCADVKLESC